MKVQLLLTVMFVFVSMSCINDSCDIRNSELSQKGISPSTRKEKGISLKDKDFPASAMLTRTPIETEYYNGFMNSSIQFSQLEFFYVLNNVMLNEDYSLRYFEISVPPSFDPTTQQLYDITLSELQNFKGHYLNRTGSIIQKSHCGLSSEVVLNLLQMIQSQGTYYFNAAEYNGQPSFEAGSELEFGYYNYVAMNIYAPGQEPYVIPPIRTFCKGWDPGDNPPAELMPVINYIENTIIPYMRGQGIP